MSQVSWIKIRTDMFSDEKIRLIEQLPEADSVLVIWVKLLALAGQKNANGEIFVNDELPYTDEMLAAIFHRKVNVVRMALTTFQKFRMIEIATDQTIVICNWAKHQNVEGLDKIRLDNQKRKKRWREKQAERKLQLRDVSDVERSGNVPLRDAERSNCVPQRDQKKKENREEPSLPSLPLRERQQQPADPDLYINTFEEAKRLICECILIGKDPGRPWSHEAQQKLSRHLPIPRLELERVAWFRGLPDDGSPELVGRKTVTETGLCSFWSDEVSRAEAYWQQRYGWREKKQSAAG